MNEEKEEKDEIYILNRSTVEENVHNDISVNLESTGTRSASQSKRNLKKEKDREREKGLKIEILELQREVIELLKQVQLDRAVIGQREDEIAVISRYISFFFFSDFVVFFLYFVCSVILVSVTLFKMSNVAYLMRLIFA